MEGRFQSLQARERMFLRTWGWNLYAWTFFGVAY